MDGTSIGELSMLDVDKMLMGNANFSIKKASSNLDHYSSNVRF
jgi:hypothetical protein